MGDDATCRWPPPLLSWPTLHLGEIAATFALAHLVRRQNRLLYPRSAKAGCREQREAQARSRTRFATVTHVPLRDADFPFKVCPYIP